MDLTGEEQRILDGEFGEGWYSSAVALKQRYCKGYFEARIRVSETQDHDDFWSAFWISSRFWE